MKIGITTFHRADNFGAVMQAFALQKYLTSLGHDVEIIDYRCPAIEMQYDIFNPRLLVSRKNILFTLHEYSKRFLSIRKRISKREKYNYFREQYINISKPVNEVNGDLGYDVYITGSDQVWNLHLTGGFDNSFFLDFNTVPRVKKLAYAASSENDPKGLLFQERERVSSCLSTYSAISVREPFLQDILSQITDKEVSVCCDPTFLINKEDYENIMVIPPITAYVLYYEMTISPTGESLARRIAKEKGLSLVIIQGGYINRKPEKGIICIQDIGPAELLGYISQADTVLTTSFHGVSLSLIFNKELWVLSHPGNLRQQHILSTLGLNRRMIDVEGMYDRTDRIDYQEINEMIDSYANSSKQFLMKNI